MKNTQRVMVFIDHSNIVHRLIDQKKVDPLWVVRFDPIKLAKHLVGNRQLVGVQFYCCPPPPHLLTDGLTNEKLYKNQMSYYSEVQKLPGIILKYARLAGVKGNLEEKNLDTQLTTDLIILATQNVFDTAILLSNDGDFSSCVDGAKSLGRKIELVYFKGKASMDLMQHCDVCRKARRVFFEELDFPKA